MAQLVDAQEEERRRISRELHDQMGQTLTAILMNIEALENAALLVVARGRFMQALPMPIVIFAFLFVNVFGFQLVDKLVRRPEGFGCFGTLLRLAGCAVVGWAAFALVVLGLALLMGLVVALD